MKIKPERKFDAVLPLTLKDFERFQILDKSIRKNVKDLNICWIITTDLEHNCINGKINNNLYRVIPESIILPELKFYKYIHKILCGNILRGRYICNKGRYNTGGWYIQQLIKLAMAVKVETEFYLTLDADVVCLRPVGYDDLIQSGKAITNTLKRDHHPDWYEDAERVLKMPRSGISHGVTPAMLNRTAVIELQNHLAKNVHFIFKLFSCVFPKSSFFNNITRSWRSYLIRNTPWTEYTLYYTFLEAIEYYHKYHIYKGTSAIYDNPSSVWLSEQINAWNIDKFLKSEAYFLVFQSNTNILVEDVLKKIGGYIE